MTHSAPLARSHQPADAAPTYDCEQLPSGFALTRSDSGGHLSIFERGALRIDAEAGTVIRVHAGCLWVPDDAEQGSVGVGAGEQIRIRRSGLITTLALRATQLELLWPATSDADSAAQQTH